MPSGGSVTIETENTTLDPSAGTDAFSVTRGPYVLLSVTDTGQGMAPDVRARAFEPFFTTKELGRGTGLGLSTVYGIVKQTGGYIWVDSELGRGTRIRIYLPRDAAAPVRLVDQRKPARREVPRGHETVMVVEDEEGVRELMQAWLESHGYRVLTAGNGVEALQTSNDFDGPIDLVVADMVMPAMGGPALVRKLKPLRPEVKVMFMSGYADATPGDRDLLDEPTMFLQKPFALAVLVDKVREALDATSARAS